MDAWWVMHMLARSFPSERPRKIPEISPKYYAQGSPRHETGRTGRAERYVFMSPVLPRPSRSRANEPQSETLHAQRQSRRLAGLPVVATVNGQRPQPAVILQGSRSYDIREELVRFRLQPMLASGGLQGAGR